MTENSLMNEHMDRVPNRGRGSWGGGSRGIRGGSRGGFRGGGGPNAGGRGGLPRGRGGPGGMRGGMGGRGGFGGQRGGALGRGGPNSGAGRGMGRGGSDGNGRGRGGNGGGGFGRGGPNRGGMGRGGMPGTRGVGADNRLRGPPQNSFYRGGGPPPKRGRWESQSGAGASNGYGNYNSANNSDYSNYNTGAVSLMGSGGLASGGALMGDYPTHLLQQQQQQPQPLDNFNAMSSTTNYGGGGGLLNRNYPNNTQQDYNSSYSDGKSNLMSRDMYAVNNVSGQGGMSGYNGPAGQGTTGMDGYGVPNNGNGNGYNMGGGYSVDRNGSYGRNGTTYGETNRANYDSGYSSSGAGIMGTGGGGGSMSGYSKDYGHSATARSSTSERGYAYDNSSYNSAPPSYSMSRDSYGGGSGGGSYMPRGGGQNRSRY